jgi:hypothetical protein
MFPRFRIVRHELDRRAEGGLGAGEIAQLLQHDPETVVRLRFPPLARDRLSDLVQRQVALAAPPRRQSQNVQGIGLIRTELQQLSAGFLGPPQIAASVKAGRPSQ